MGFKATEVQQQLMETLTDGRFRIVGFGGGIRGTKTWGSLAAVITLCRIFPRSRWAVVRKDLPRLRQNTLPSFEKLRAQAGGFVGPVNQSTWTATCSNGSQIIFFSESLDVDPDLSRWKGLEVNGFVLEESDELAERSFYKAIERAGAWIVPSGTQPPPFVICTFNPCANWPKHIFYEPWKNGTIAEPYAFIPATAADNPYIAAEQREAWRSMPSFEYKRFVEGDWDVLTGRFYDGLTAPVHIVQRAQLPNILPDWWEYWGAYDWGYAHWAPFGQFCKDTEGRIVLLDTIWMRRQQDHDMASTIVQTADPRCVREVYAGHDCWAKVTAHGASGRTVNEVFYESGIWLVKADTDLVNGGRAVRRALSVTDGSNGPGFVMVDTPGNRRVFDQLANTMPDENNVNKPAKVDADAEGRGGDDGADMVRYGLATKVRVPTLGERFNHAGQEPHHDPNLKLRTIDGKPPRWIGPGDPDSEWSTDAGSGYAEQLPVNI